jgi:hypothetical protein
MIDSVINANLIFFLGDCWVNKVVNPKKHRHIAVLNFTVTYWGMSVLSASMFKSHPQITNTPANMVNKLTKVINLLF